jgi:hypothetical protein
MAIYWKVPKIASEDQMVLYFVSRADRYLKELRELVPTSPPASLRNVGRDRGTGSPQLRRQSECLSRGNPLVAR